MPLSWPHSWLAHTRLARCTYINPTTCVAPWCGLKGNHYKWALNASATLLAILSKCVCVCVCVRTDGGGNHPQCLNQISEVCFSYLTAALNRTHKAVTTGVVLCNWLTLLTCSCYRPFAGYAALHALFRAFDQLMSPHY